MEINPRIQSAIIEVVNQQIENNDPPQTAITLSRLIADGCSADPAKELIGCVVISEVFDVLKSGEKFDLDRYVAALDRLPEIPQDKV
ncbi:MAG: hypothetical protein J7K75_00175 [Desulfuromonas sp.]|nr:hypothetical protein [Desulfuromonas sp.]